MNFHETLCSLGSHPVLCPTGHRLNSTWCTSTLAGAGPATADPGGRSDQVLPLFKPSCVNAKPILKPINNLPVLLIRFSMRRIPRGVQRVCFPTFIGQLHSPCIPKRLQGASSTRAGNSVAAPRLILHSEVALPRVGKGKVCGAGCGEVSPDPSREFVFFICLYNRSTATVPWSSSQV